MQPAIRGRGAVEADVEMQQRLQQDEDPGMKSSPAKLRARSKGQDERQVSYVLMTVAVAAIIFVIVYLNGSGVPSNVASGAAGSGDTSAASGAHGGPTRHKKQGRPDSVSLNTEPCPKKCRGGAKLDVSICPKLNAEAVQEIHENLNSLSVVWEWGAGPSAAYFAPCVSSWHVVLSHPAHCEDFIHIKPDNVQMHCVWGKKGFTEGYVNAVSALDNSHELVDVVVVDGLAKLDAVLAIASKLRPSSVVFVSDWEELQSDQSLSKVTSTFNVVKEMRDEQGATVAMLKIKHSDNPTAYTPAPDTPDDARTDAKESPNDEEDKHEDAEEDEEDEEEEENENEEEEERPKRKRQKTSRKARSRMRRKMKKWQKDPIVMRWKQDRRDKILGDSVPDKYGPLQGYPCADTCPSGKLYLENTVCPMMFKEEAELLFKALKPESVVWEWGTGASSLYFSQCVKKWTSIEHVTAWCLEMRSVAPPNTEVRCVPIEPQYRESFGDPGTWDGSKKEFSTYVDAIHSLGDCTDCLDVVIIDGRARKDCAVEVLPYLRHDSVVFVHDWIKERFGGDENYDKALQYYEVADYVYVPAPPGGTHSGLVMLKPKEKALKTAKREWKKKHKKKKNDDDDDAGADEDAEEDSLED